MPDQILVLRETARAGPGPGDGGGVVLPPGSKLGVYGDSLSYRLTWQPTVTGFFGGIPLGNGGEGSTTAAWRPGQGDAHGTGSSNSRITNFLANTAGTINTIWFGANDWFYANAYSEIAVGDETEFPKALTAKNRSTWAGAVSYMIERFYTAIPTGLHILLSPSYIQGSENSPIMHDMVRLADAAAQYHGCPYINLWRDAGINGWNRTSFLNDNVHMDPPTGNSGALRVANLVIDKIMTYHRATTLIAPAIAPLIEYEEEPSTAWAREQDRKEAEAAATRTRPARPRR